MKNPEIDLSMFSQLIFYKGIKAMAPSMRKKHLFSKWAGKTRKKYRKKKNDPYPLLIGDLDTRNYNYKVPGRIHSIRISS